jgi:Arc/MetJ-type ribon-helix-helix transcriptional regulator
MKANATDGERITLRLEQTDLVLIDKYIEQHPEFSSRSHLARIAIHSLIEGDAEADEPIESSPKKNMITVEIPKAIFAVMEDSINRGEYTSYQSVIEELVRGKFLSAETSKALNTEVQVRVAKTVDMT